MKNDDVIKRFREGFCMEEVWLCTCGHEAESHYWNGGGNPQHSGYDACRVEGCWCVYDEDKLELKQKYFENKPFEKFLLAEIKRAREECYKQMDELINVSVASGEIDIIKHSFHSKLQALKEEL